MYLNWPRLNLLSGVLFVVLLIAGTALVGVPDTDHGESIVTDFASHRDRIMIGGYLMCLALLALVAWGWAWRSLLAGSPQRHIGTAILLGAAISAAVEFPVPAFFMSLAYISDQPVDPQVARAMLASAQVFSYVDYFPTVILFAAMGWAILESGAISRWFGWTAFAVALMSLVAAYPPLKVDVIGAIVDSLWIVTTAVALFRAPSARVAFGLLAPEELGSPLVAARP